MAIRSTLRRHRNSGAQGPDTPSPHAQAQGPDGPDPDALDRGVPGPGRHRDGQRVHRPGFGVHWILTGLLLGGAGWMVIGALVAAAFRSWAVAGWLMVGCAALVGTLLLLAASSRRVRRARAAEPEPAAAPEPTAQEPVAQRHLTVLPRPDQVA
jgi:hypothetical protein